MYRRHCWTLSIDSLVSQLAENAIKAPDYDFWVVDLQGAEPIDLQGASVRLSTVVRSLPKRGRLAYFNVGFSGKNS